jgi:hypothetical protein
MTLKQLVESLPADVQHEVQDFAEYLLQKRGAHRRDTPTFSWAGILADERDTFTSVQLQHEVLRERGASA